MQSEEDHRALCALIRSDPERRYVLLSRGVPPGCLMAFELRDGHDAAAAVMASVKVMTAAVSLGSVDTLIQHPAGLTHRMVDEKVKAATGITPGLLRLSVGIEDVEDLWDDLAQALEAGSK